jgi:hypothetical protein
LLGSGRQLLPFAIGMLLVVTAFAIGPRAQELEAPSELPPPSSALADDPNEDADQGQPQARPQAQPPPGTLFPSLEFPGRADIAEFRRLAYDKYGLTFGASYQQLFQWSSATVPSANNDTALGAWAAASVTWAPSTGEGTTKAR